jgi:hypothetical protein
MLLTRALLDYRVGSMLFWCVIFSETNNGKNEKDFLWSFFLKNLIKIAIKPISIKKG